ncbi:polysaccharide deacetylase family protein [Cohnella cellulosilytica]|uniref:Polysaccharide deacetylase family protein n=1 Tax=Cohnella cellulosilytica TaxID=986710 RepID=A0ABW2F2C1_9BACL
MGNKYRDRALDSHKKNRRKKIKTAIQLVLLALVGYILFHALVDVERYKEPERSEWTSDQGFVALSYFGVSRTGTPKLISKRELDKQLKALKDQGFVAVSQQDVLDYYREGKKLPDKALFLSFEDGRNDSALFAQPLLEKYNFKATFLSYANKMGNGERKFLQPKEMKKMTRNGYWELGSNGYRLAYINIFDSEGRFVGMKDESELRNKMKIDYYNHYLMDFLRDEEMIPTETRSEMEARITEDYRLMEEIYTAQLGFVPNVYMIMHANALGQGMNRLVTAANEAEIKRIFKMHFNRDGVAFNGKNGDLYDLTRVQPAAYWYTNHLLMKIAADTGQRMQFLTGDAKRAKDWTLVGGAAEFIDNRIALTSLPAAPGTLVLNGSEGYRDVELEATLTGNVVGRQSIYVRYDRERNSFVRISLDNNQVTVEQKKAGQDVERLVQLELDEPDWKETDLALNKATVYSKAQTSELDLTEETRYPVNIAGKRKLAISVSGSELRVTVDGNVQTYESPIDDGISAGSVALESEYNVQNERDDIYDGVFEDVQIKGLYSNRYTGLNKWVKEIERSVNRAVDWMIETF